MPADFGFYAQSYRFAGEGLIEKAHAEQLEDFYVYPIGYIYRHAIELALKHDNYLVEDALAARDALGYVAPADRLTHEEVEAEMQGLPFHRLAPLLSRLERRLRLIDSAEPIPPDVTAAILAVDGFDPDGQRWRFPYLSKGRGPSFRPPRKGQFFIDLDGIRETIDPVLGYLIDGLDGWLSADIDASAAMREDIGM
jgi:hypothetical protein